MRLVMRGEKDLAVVKAPESAADLPRQMQLLPDPQRQRIAEAGESRGGVAEVGLKEPLEDFV